MLYQKSGNGYWNIYQKTTGKLVYLESAGRDIDAYLQQEIERAIKKGSWERAEAFQKICQVYCFPIVEKADYQIHVQENHGESRYVERDKQGRMADSRLLRGIPHLSPSKELR